MTDSFDMAAVRALKNYLATEVPLLNEVYEEWPYHGNEMQLPCLSVITAGSPSYLNMQPYTYSKIVDPLEPLNDIFTEVVAQLDGRIQLDIWTEYKVQRGKILDLVTKAINKQNINSDLPNGLSLTLSNYHNVIARYDIVSYNYMDNEENSQKAQWRAKLDLLFSHVVVEVKSRPRMSQIELVHQISSDKNVSDDNTDIEENLVI